MESSSILPENQSLNVMRVSPPSYNESMRAGFDLHQYPQQGFNPHPTVFTSHQDYQQGFDPLTAGYSPHPGGEDDFNQHQPGCPHYTPPRPQVQIVTRPAIMYARTPGQRPARMTCTSCHQPILSRTEAATSSRAHIISLLLCMIGCWPCCWIPYCMDECRNTNHYCPNCNAYLGRYEFK